MTVYWAQEAWRDVPLATIVGDDRDGSFVVAGENALDQAMIARLETDPVADTEIEHAGMGPHLLEETQALDNPVVEANEFSLTQLINIYVCHLITECNGALRVTRRWAFARSADRPGRPVLCPCRRRYALRAATCGGHPKARANGGSTSGNTTPRTGDRGHPSLLLGCWTLHGRARATDTMTRSYRLDGSTAGWRRLPWCSPGGAGG